MADERRPFVSRFFAELRRRRVFRVAGGYLLGGWIAVEAASVLVPELLLPPWITRVVILLVIAGLPLALALAWTFDVTPDGVTRTPPTRTPGDGGSTAEGPGSPSGPRPVPGAGAASGAGAGSRVAGPETRKRIPGWRRVVRPSTVALAGVMALGGGTVVADRIRDAREREARALVREAEVLAREGRWFDAYALAVRAEKVLPDDSALTALWPVVSDVLTVRTEPAGARIVARHLPTGPADTAAMDLGSSPVEERRIPRAPHHLLIEKEGFAPEERLASSALVRDESYGEDRRIVLEVELVPAGEAPPGTVHVAGAPYELVSPDVPSGLAAPLDGYFIDRHEVSNARFREFVTGGGYLLAALWPSPIVVAGDTLALQEVARRFVDRTGLPGPRDWTSQLPPPGLEDHPVTGVSWYEAAAYCAFREMALPSVFQWEKAARDGRTTHLTGVVMPWGLQGPADPFVERANFAGSGTVAVDAHPFGISPWGAYGLAGNVKEWTANPVGDGRAVTGGSWEDPLYLFSEVGTFDPGSASASLGFRCARVRASDARRARDQGTFALEIDGLTPSYEPVDEATFRSFLSHYRYDPRPLEAEVLERSETPEWVRERITFAGPAGGRVLAYLWLPRSTPAPHQTVLYVPGSDAFYGTTTYDHVERWVGGLVRSGRAIFSVVLHGMTERPWGPDHQPPEFSSVGFRDLMVRHATEIRLGLDYLETRDDVASGSIAYMGISLGAGSRLAFAAVDDRYRSVVLVGGGIDERMKPTLPEADNVNFAPYIRPPKLLLNGREDEEHPWFTRALPLWNLLAEPKELVLVDGAGHVPPAEILIPTVNDFLDRTLGPVRR